MRLYRAIKFIKFFVFGFPVLLFSQTELNIEYSLNDPLLHMSLYDIGVIVPSYSHGIQGSYINPAAIALGKGKGQFFFSLNLKKGYPSRFSIPVLKASKFEALEGDLNIPVTFSINEKMGFDLIGFSYNFKGWSLGAGLFSPTGSEFKLKGQIGIATSVTFDSVPSSFITEDGDTVNITWQVHSFGKIKACGSGSIKYSRRTLFLRAGKKLGIFSIGAGYNLDIIKGEGDLNFEGAGTLDSVIAVSKKSDLPVETSANLKTLLSDTFVSTHFHGSVKGLRNTFVVGTEVSLIFLKIGATGSISFPFKFKTRDAFARAIYASGIPQVVNFSPSTELTNDTLYIRDTLEFTKIQKDSLELISRNIEYSSSTVFGFSGGISLLGLLHLGGAVNFMPVSRGAFGNFKWGLGLRLPIPFGSFQFAFVRNTDYLLDKTGAFIPLYTNGYIGAGGNIGFAGLNFSAGAKINLLALGKLFVEKNVDLNQISKPAILRATSLSFAISKSF